MSRPPEHNGTFADIVVALAKKYFGVDPRQLGWRAFVTFVFIIVVCGIAYGVFIDVTGKEPANVVFGYAGDLFCEIAKIEQCLHRPKIDQADWTKAQNADTLDGYEVYLRTQPNGKYADQAQRNKDLITRDDSDWGAAQRINTEESYKGYLDQHAQGRHKDTARELQLDHYDWNKAKAADAIPDYQKYLKTHAGGQHVDEAKLRITVKANKVSALPESKERSAQIDPFKECDACPVMVVIAGGTFKMGSPQSTNLARKSEWPQHVVTIEGRIAVGQAAVTFAEWSACVDERGCQYRPEGQGARALDLPVTGISWHDADEYVKWLSQKTGKKYRLLSEAEREFVTRAGTATAYWTGDAITPDQANFNKRRLQGDGNIASPDPNAYREKLLPARSFAPNSWGLFQVHGNAWEWVADCWHDNYDGAPLDGSPWTKPGCRNHVIRGGSFINSAEELRSATRQTSASEARTNMAIGFRVARPLLR